MPIMIFSAKLKITMNMTDIFGDNPLARYLFFK